MENRWSQRTPVELNLIIHYGPIGLIRARSIDISKKGMLIDTGLILLSPDEVIEVTFSSPEIFDSGSASMNASVIHSGEQGAGIEFINHSLDKLYTEPSLLLRKVAS